MHSITTWTRLEGVGGRKMSVFVHTQSLKTVHAGGGGVKKWQNSVHVVVGFPLRKKQDKVESVTASPRFF